MPEVTTESFPEIKLEKKHISEQLLKKIKPVLFTPNQFAQGDERKKNNQIREKQERFLSLLPENIIDQLEAHLMDELLYALKKKQKANEYLIESGKPTFQELSMEELVSREIRGVQIPNEERPSTILQGELFEMMCEIQSRQDGYLTKNKGLNSEEKEELRNMADVLLSVISHPDRHGLGSNGDRIPDIVDFQIDKEKNELRIKKIFEAKSGTHLGVRALKQLRESGFKKTFNTISSKVNDIENADQNGLVGFGKEGLRVILDENVTQALMVCRGIKPKNATFNEDIDKLIGNMSREEKGEFKALLKDHKTKFIESPFSNSEIRAITMILLKEIDNKINSKNKELSLN